MVAEGRSSSLSSHRAVSRPRASYSCHACRARRVKCDKVHPRCSRCVKDEQTCTYDQHPRPKRERPQRRSKKQRVWEEKEKREPNLLEASQRPPRDRNLPGKEHDTVPGLGYLSLQRGGHSRYVGRTFWAFTEDSTNDLDMLLQDQDRHSTFERGKWPFQPICPTCQLATDNSEPLSPASSKYPTSQAWLSSWQGSPSREKISLHDGRPLGQYAAALPGLLNRLPPRTTCDLLYSSFVTSIHAILPLIHLPTFDEEYNRFWVFIEERHKCEPSRGILGENPSFLSLLFAVLFGGAVSCSSDVLKSQFKLTPRATVSSLLCEAATRTQDMVFFPRNPTIYSLTSFLIVQNLLVREEEPLASCSYLSVALRAAQAMGLHRDGSHFGLDPIQTEMRRRIWWHIIHTDVMTSIPSALPPSCLSDAIYDTKMIGEAKDSYIDRAVGPESQFGTKEQATHMQTMYPSSVGADMLDIRLMVAVDRYTITSTLRRILRRQFDTTPLTRVDFASLNEEVDALDSRITARLDQLRSVCNRQRAEHMYEGDFDGPTFVKWAQLLLQLMVHKTYCVLYQPLVRDPRHPMWAQVRHDCIDHCQRFIQAFCGMCTPGPFRPFHWLYPGLYQPLHAAVVLLSDLLRAPQSPEAGHSMTLIDRLFSLITPGGGVAASEDSGVLAERNLSHSGKEAWTLLRRLRRKAWDKAGRDPDVLWTEDSRQRPWPEVAGPTYSTTESAVSSTLLPWVPSSPTQELGTSLGQEPAYPDLPSEPLEYWDYITGPDPCQFHWMRWDASIWGDPDSATDTIS